ncbi:unnamed protein product, partial [Polarella glacialis]
MSRAPEQKASLEPREGLHGPSGASALKPMQRRKPPEDVLRSLGCWAQVCCGAASSSGGREPELDWEGLEGRHGRLAVALRTAAVALRVGPALRQLAQLCDEEGRWLQPLPAEESAKRRADLQEQLHGCCESLGPSFCLRSGSALKAPTAPVRWAPTWEGGSCCCCCWLLLSLLLLLLLLLLLCLLLLLLLGPQRRAQGEVVGAVESGLGQRLSAARFASSSLVNNKEARRVIAADLGRRVELVFEVSPEAWEPVLVTPQSFVFHWRLRSGVSNGAPGGQEVAVKVQREACSLDLVALRTWLVLARRRWSVPGWRVLELALDKAREELNYQQRAKEQESYRHALLLRVQDIEVPRVCWQATGMQVLTTTWVQGPRLFFASRGDCPEWPTRCFGPAAGGLVVASPAKSAAGSLLSLALQVGATNDALEKESGWKRM